MEQITPVIEKSPRDLQQRLLTYVAYRCGTSPKVSLQAAKLAYRLSLDYASSFLKSSRYSEIYEGVEQFCLFLGYPRSGHTLIRSLIDAHPNAIIANELHALLYLQLGFSKSQIFYLLIKKSENYAAKDPKLRLYSYQVPNQWQGRFKRLTVIGDKKGGGSVLILGRHPHLLQQMRDTMGIPIKFIHVIRNPYDNISSMYLRGSEGSLQRAAMAYFGMAQTVAKLKTQIRPENIFDIRQEAIIADPMAQLRSLCRFLSLDQTEDYLRDCASIVYASLPKSRLKVPWTDEVIASVKLQMEQFDFLSGYSFED
jgi:hypothetical protein